MPQVVYRIRTKEMVDDRLLARFNFDKSMDITTALIMKDYINLNAEIEIGLLKLLLKEIKLTNYVLRVTHL